MRNYQFPRSYIDLLLDECLTDSKKLQFWVKHFTLEAQVYKIFPLSVIKKYL